MTLQERNDEQVDLLSADFQLRYEPNFAWKSAASALLGLPALRGAWPMSSVAYTAADRARDISSQGNHLTANNTPVFSYDGLAPYVDFDGVNQYLDRADGGASNWADILGTESYIVAAQRGLTLGGWFRFDQLAANEGLMAKWDGGTNNRSYLIQKLAGIAVSFLVSSNGIAVAASTTSGTITTSVWYHIVGRFVPSTTVDIFLSGVRTSSGIGVPAALHNGTANFEVGIFNTGTTQPYDGNASMLFLCAAALSDSSIQALYQQQRAMFGV